MHRARGRRQLVRVRLRLRLRVRLRLRLRLRLRVRARGRGGVRARCAWPEQSLRSVERVDETTCSPRSEGAPEAPG